MTPLVRLPRKLAASAVHRLSDRLSAWPEQSQQGARRNAMVACTALAARRAEREDVEEFLEARTATPRHAPATASR